MKMKTRTKNPPKAMEAGLIGWREQFAKRIEKPVSKRTPLNGQQIRAILGALFVINTALYLGRVVRRAIAQRG
jgi:hypothetical protein